VHLKWLKQEFSSFFEDNENEEQALQEIEDYANEELDSLISKLQSLELSSKPKQDDNNDFYKSDKPKKKIRMMGMILINLLQVE